MKIVYMILAHDCPGHLQRLVDALSSPDSACLIHIDAKANINIFSNIAGRAVSFTRNRVRVHWGDFSQVAAIRVLCQEALASAAQYDRFVLLSGVDYPLRPPAYLETFFEAHLRTQFIELVAMPSADTSKPLSRLTDYQPDPPRSTLGALLRRLRRRMGERPRQRDYRQALRDLRPYAGATWWALTRDACEYIESFVNEHPQVVDFFRNTVCPDEMFIHTILGNSPFRADVRGALTYADWSGKGTSPAYLTNEHIDMFRHSSLCPDGSEILFARKFSDDRPAVATALAEFLHQRRWDESAIGTGITPR